MKARTLLWAENIGLQRSGRDCLRQVSFAMAPGEGWCVAGESGAGKSTLLNLVLGLEEPSQGRILLKGEPWSPLPERERRGRRPLVQAVFQEAQASLPPHLSGWEILQEPLAVWNRGDAPARREAAARMAARVSFPERALDQRPEAWSGGLAQRLCLARALMLAPELLVLDEPFSALDPTLAGHLLSVLVALKAEGTALLLACHDLAAAGQCCDHLLLLKEGAPVCQGPFEALVSNPPHPHLQALLDAAPGWAER